LWLLHARLQRRRFSKRIRRWSRKNHSQTTTPTAISKLTYSNRAPAPDPAAEPAGSLPLKPTVPAARSAMQATVSWSWSPTCARRLATRCARSPVFRERTSTAPTSTSTSASTRKQTLRCSETAALVWELEARCRWTALSGVVVSYAREWSLYACVARSSLESSSCHLRSQDHNIDVSLKSYNSPTTKESVPRAGLEPAPLSDFPLTFAPAGHNRSISRYYPLDFLRQCHFH
jgi:hypothetical protein